MKKKTLFNLCVVLTGMVITAHADPVTVNQVGVGTRAYSLANNYVALSSDMSGVYWNPAALAFLPVREFQAAFDILDNHNVSEFGGVNTESNVRRIRLSNIGFLTSLPATQGGLTFAGSFQAPFIFDDNPTFMGTYRNVNNQSLNVEQDYKGYGGLNFITGAFGLQVAQGFGVGAALSFVVGSEKTSRDFYQTTDGVVLKVYDDYFHQSIDRGYIGYDCRVGLFYLPTEMIRIGMRLSLPQTIWFDENFSEDYPKSASQTYSANPTGQLYSSYSGAMGVAVRMPFLTVSTELRARAPYDIAYPDWKIPSSSAAAHVKMGAGLGLEAPIFTSKWVARCGYSWDQYDPYAFVRKYDHEPMSWDMFGLSSKQDRNLLTGGIAYVDKNWCIEGAYGYQLWKLDTQWDSNIVLKENRNMNRFTLSFSIHY
jgi:hypothetical protein